MSDDERIPVHKIRPRQARKLLRASPHQHLRVAVIGTSPVSCAVARALGKNKFANVTLFTGGQQLATYSYVDAALFEKAFAFIRTNAFPGSTAEMTIQRSSVRFTPRVSIEQSPIMRIDPKKKEISVGDDRIHGYDVLLIPNDMHACALDERVAESHRFVTSGDDVMALHTFFAARVEETPKRNPIDIVCDATSRTGRELMTALASQLPKFAARYGHPRETIHLHDASHVPHEAITEHEIHVHIHTDEKLKSVTAGELLAHPGHILLPAFGSGLSGVDVVHAVLAHIALHPMRSIHFDVPDTVEYYTEPHRAYRRGREGVFVYVFLRVRDLWRAIRAYGIMSGIRAWRGLKI